MLDDYIFELERQKSQLDIHDSQFNDWLDNPVTRDFVLDLQIAKLRTIKEICLDEHLDTDGQNRAAFNAMKGSLKAVSLILEGLEKRKDEES